MRLFVTCFELNSTEKWKVIFNGFINIISGSSDKVLSLHFFFLFVGISFFISIWFLHINTPSIRELEKIYSSPEILSWSNELYNNDEWSSYIQEEMYLGPYFFNPFFHIQYCALWILRILVFFSLNLPYFIFLFYMNLNEELYEISMIISAVIINVIILYFCYQYYCSLCRLDWKEQCDFWMNKNGFFWGNEIYQLRECEKYEGMRITEFNSSVDSFLPTQLCLLICLSNFLDEKKEYSYKRILIPRYYEKEVIKICDNLDFKLIERNNEKFSEVSHLLEYREEEDDFWNTTENGNHTILYTGF